MATFVGVLATLSLGKRTLCGDEMSQ